MAFSLAILAPNRGGQCAQVSALHGGLMDTLTQAMLPSTPAMASGDLAGAALPFLPPDTL